MEMSMATVIAIVVHMFIIHITLIVISTIEKKKWKAKEIIGAMDGNFTKLISAVADNKDTELNDTNHTSLDDHMDEIFVVLKQIKYHLEENAKMNQYNKLLLNDLKKNNTDDMMDRVAQYVGDQVSNIRNDLLFIHNDVMDVSSSLHKEPLRMHMQHHVNEISIMDDTRTKVSLNIECNINTIQSKPLQLDIEECKDNKSEFACSIIESCEEITQAKPVDDINNNETSL
eukprot:148526_1